MKDLKLQKGTNKEPAPYRQIITNLNARSETRFIFITSAGTLSQIITNLNARSETYAFPKYAR